MSSMRARQKRRRRGPRVTGRKGGFWFVRKGLLKGGTHTTRRGGQRDRWGGAESSRPLGRGRSTEGTEVGRPLERSHFVISWYKGLYIPPCRGMQGVLGRNRRSQKTLSPGVE